MVEKNEKKRKIQEEDSDMENEDLDDNSAETDSEYEEDDLEDEDIEIEIEGEENESIYDDSNDKVTRKQKEFLSLSAEDLINSQQEQVIHCHEVLGVPLSVAGALLRAYNWDKEKLFVDFFDNRDRVIKKANIDLTDYVFHKGDARKEMTCPVCYDDYPGDQMLALSCKHFLCTTCLKDYIEVEIKDGPACLHSKCPYPKCNVLIDETLVKELVNKNAYTVYSKFIARSFVDDNPRIKWCPAPDCGRAVYCPETVTDTVTCQCGTKFCFKCGREDHVPCSCEELQKWLKKERDESETATWLTANTKDCPKCNRSIEKNGGCNHMTCSLCKYEFCWVCMEDWKEHNSNTGGYYKCNRYKPEELAQKTKETDREVARRELEKYMHYFKRYANHDKSQKFEKQLREKAEDKMKELTQINKYSSWVDVEYIQKAVQTLCECRGSLKYTYVYGYYLEEGQEKNLFEYLQEDLERVTERLSEILESTPVEKFDRDEIISTTRSAATRLQHLLEGSSSGLVKERK
jgi:ariadne-1